MFLSACPYATKIESDSMLFGGFRSEQVVLICRYTVILILLTSLYTD